MQRNGISIKESTKTASELADFFWQIKHVYSKQKFLRCILYPYESVKWPQVG